jgi:hypothetical protein
LGCLLRDHDLVVLLVILACKGHWFWSKVTEFSLLLIQGVLELTNHEEVNEAITYIRLSNLSVVKIHLGIGDVIGDNSASQPEILLITVRVLIDDALEHISEHN